MASILYSRIEELCNSNNVSITRLEKECGFSNATIKKWKETSIPGIDKVQKIAKYFNVTTDYLLGITNIPTPADELLGDSDIVTLQRAKSKMSPVDRERMMQMLKIAFEYAFRDEQ
jgi:transcriptional regulator with XRE-family HTH domain